jgi:hypothetical protein
LLALFGHAAISELSLLSGVKQKLDPSLPRAAFGAKLPFAGVSAPWGGTESDFGTFRSVDDPHTGNDIGPWRPRRGLTSTPLLCRVCPARLAAQRAFSNRTAKPCAVNMRATLFRLAKASSARQRRCFIPMAVGNDAFRRSIRYQARHAHYDRDVRTWRVDPLRRPM